MPISFIISSFINKHPKTRSKCFKLASICFRSAFFLHFCDPETRPLTWRTAAYWAWLERLGCGPFNDLWFRAQLPMTVEINRVKVKVFSELTWPICVGSGLPIECRNFVPRDRMVQSAWQICEMARQWRHPSRKFCLLIIFGWNSTICWLDMIVRWRYNKLEYV